MQFASFSKEKTLADRACSFIIEANFDEVLGSISAALLCPVIDPPWQRLVVELKEVHNTVKVGSCGVNRIDWLK